MMESKQIMLLLPIHKKWDDEIFALRKTLELRKSVPKAAEWPLTVLLYETKSKGGAGAIVGQFTCPGFIGCKGLYATMTSRSLLDAEAIESYAKGRMVYGLLIEQPQRYAQPVPLERYGITRAPQNWCYVDLAERRTINGV